MSRSKIISVDQEETADVGFASRWSRLKHEARRDIEDAATENVAVETGDLPVQQTSSAEILTDDDMPDLANMTPDSDYTDFLSPGVSEELRKLALRKLFHSEVFNIRDGLDEYDGDYTQFEKLGSLVTSDMRHQIELEAQRKAQQMLENKEQLPDNEILDDRGVDNTGSDSPDENTIAAVNPATSVKQIDEQQTLIVEETDVESIAIERNIQTKGQDYD